MIGHVDVSTGISGDKLVCALMQVCEKEGTFDREGFTALFARLLPEARIGFSERLDHGIRGLGLEIEARSGNGPEGLEGGGVLQAADSRPQHNDTGNVEGGSHIDGGNGMDAEYIGRIPAVDTRSQGHGHVPHRKWNGIRGEIAAWRDDGSITAGAADRALKTFRIVAEAEAQVHGMPVDEVAFHEVGAIDSIVDIVGASVLLDALGIEELHSSTVCLGYGTIECAHGTLPVPAPATAVICQDIPVESGAYEGEMTTPTGAALLKANVTHWSPMPAMVPHAIGIGLGTRELDGTANSLRIIAGDPVSRVLPCTPAYSAGRPGEDGAGDAADAKPGGAGATPDGDDAAPDMAGTVPGIAPMKAQAAGMYVESCILLQTNVDHLSPENVASSCEDLLGSGALDVWQQPIAMKKGRLGSMLNVLARPEDADRLCELACRLTGSLGIHRTSVERSVAPRGSETIGTPFGQVRYKVAWPDEPARRPHWTRPEHDDVARIARKTGRSFADVEEELACIREKHHPDNG